MYKFACGCVFGILLAGLGIMPTSFLQSISSSASAEWNKHVQIARQFNEWKESR
jgi:hypothetical protein